MHWLVSSLPSDSIWHEIGQARKAHVNEQCPSKTYYYMQIAKVLLFICLIGGERIT